MNIINDDRPHPVPSIAYLRYKENWFFLIMDKESDVFGAIHIVSEPGFERIRFASHLRIKGELLQYGSEIPFPSAFGFAEELGDGKFTARFIKAHEQIDISLHDDKVDLDVSFLARSPMFDFAEYDYANPDKVTMADISGLGSRQLFVHKQQGMRTKGKVIVKTGASAGRTFDINGLGYRDHSRTVRCDNMTLRHVWTGMHFPNHVFGPTTVTSLIRPAEPASCGYVYDEKGGIRSLRQVDITNHGRQADGVPETVEFRLTDINDQPFTIVADLTRRYAHVPLHVEKPGAMPFVYTIVENFAPLTLKESGETGIGLVEVGWSSSAAK